MCADLSDEERKADRSLFFRSIHSTLNHLLFADMAWLSRFKQESIELPGMGQDLFSDFEALRQARREWDDRISDWASALTEQWLSQDFTYTSRLDGITRTHPNWLLTSHLFNHGTHHGSTDIPFMTYEIY